ncbi:YrhK family protein [Bacillus sp. AK128]
MGEKMLKKLKNRTTLDEQTIQIQLRKKKMIIKNRYQLFYYLNNIFQGLLYMVGSILFLIKINRVIAISFFLAGSILMVTRSVIHIIRDIHLMRLGNEDNYNSE